MYALSKIYSKDTVSNAFSKSMIRTEHTGNLPDLSIVHNIVYYFIIFPLFILSCCFCPRYVTQVWTSSCKGTVNLLLMGFIGTGRYGQIISDGEYELLCENYYLLYPFYIILWQGYCYSTRPPLSYIYMYSSVPKVKIIFKMSLLFHIKQPFFKKLFWRH